MSITYKTEKLQCDRIYRRDESAGSFSFVQYGHSSWDILETTTAVGDNIIFAQNNTNGGKFWKVELNIATAIDVTSINGVWEARGELTSKYGNTWTPVTVISDTSNMFQNAGIQTIEIIPPDLWENIAVATGLNFYAWNLRFRITDIGTINNVGNISYVYTYPNRIVVDAETFTMKDVYDADVFNGWGVVSKNGSSYSVNASIKANSNTTFNTKAETITFLDNYMAYFLGTVNVGELSSTNKPLNGSTIMMYGSNSDYNNNYFGKDNSTYYDMTIKFPRKDCEVASQGFWSGGVGAYYGQKVAGGVH